MTTNAENCRVRRLLLKRAVFSLFGGRCQNPHCGWVNEDGSKGCTDERVLQIDHVEGTDKKIGENQRGGYSLYYAIFLKKLPLKRFQLLCSNCNWIKRHTHKESKPHKIGRWRAR